MSKIIKLLSIDLVDGVNRLAAGKERTVPISAVWLRTTLGGRIEVCVGLDDHWRLVIDVPNDNNISHIIEPGGIRAAKLDLMTEKAE